ncbi:MAG: F0F1 ATP synthase subunit epsilon [Deltaproteobacteria bacterium]|nr:F0F1 ATP synthase subunit epsilon [Deltaproteobacteria bacterium]
MAGDISLRVVTPVRLVLEERVDELTAPGPLGQLGILPDHAALMTTLDIGRLSYKQGGSTTVVTLAGGYAEVLENVVTVLADAAEFPDEIDTARAETARARAETALEETDATDEEALSAARAALQRALVRLETAARR